MSGVEHTSDVGDAGSSEFLEALIHHGNSKKQGSAFLEKLYEILMNEEYEKFISWCEDGKSILIKRVEDFSQIVLPKYYKHNNFQSFVRQLNMYNFTKTSHDANRREFKQPLFRKGKRNLLPLICRKTQKTIRSMDSTLEGIDAGDLYDVVTLKGDMMQGKSLVRCKSIDSSSHVQDKDNSLWEVVQELKMRVNALENKLSQVTKGNVSVKQERMQHTSPYLDTHNYLNNSCNNLQCCPTCKDIFSPMKKARSNSDKSVSSVSVFSEDESHFAGKPRSRSISLSSYESASSCGNFVESNGIPHRAKRGVDAILSAAEILHDGLPIKSQSKISQEKNISLTGSKIPLESNDKSDISLKKKKKSTSTKSVETAAASSVPSHEIDGIEAQSDSSSSPLYFQDKDEENCISQQDVSRNAGLALRRSSSIS